MTKDLNHGICNIEYNCINLPSRVEFIDGSKVLYTYDANGTKLRTDYYINPMSAVVPQAANEQGASSATNLKHTWTDYCGNFIYENDTLKQTLIEGGYISYEYPKNASVTSIDNNHKNDVVNTISGALGASISLSNGIIQAHSNVTAGNGFCSYQNTVTEILGSDVGKLYSVGSKVCTALSVLSTTRSTINTLSYYNNGGNNWRDGGKYFIDTTFSVLGFSVQLVLR